MLKVYSQSNYDITKQYVMCYITIYMYYLNILSLKLFINIPKKLFRN